MINSETLITLMLITLVIGISCVVYLMIKDIFCSKEVKQVEVISIRKDRFARKYTNKR
jgi:hypothetical protein